MLNKIITTSVLIVASAVITNAAELFLSEANFSTATCTDLTYDVSDPYETNTAITFNTGSGNVIWKNQNLSDLYVPVGNSSSKCKLSAASFSIASWVNINTNDTNISSKDHILLKTQDAQSGLKVGLNGSNLFFALNNVKNYNFALGASPVAGEWAHYALTVNLVNNGSTPTTTVKAYLNGELKGSLDIANLEIYPISSKSENTITIGTDIKNGTSVDYPLNGSIDNWQLYSGVLTDSEISALAIIPEPSMFGLLAGLGALALVGSRRRRK